MEPRRIPRASLALTLLALPGCIIHISSGGSTKDSWRHAYNAEVGQDGPRIRGNGIELREERALGAFDAVDARGFFEVRVRVGDPQRVTVRGDENVVPRVLTKVVGGALELSMEEGRYSVDRPLVVDVSVPDLRAVTLAGSGPLEVGGLDREQFAAALTGSGNLVLRGRSSQLALDLTGSGNVDARGLEAGRVNVSLTGSGGVRVHAREALEVRIAGSGDVRYQGEPDLAVSITGSGTVGRD